MTEIKRYDFGVDDFGEGTPFRNDNDGRVVFYEDHAAEVARLNEQVRALDEFKNKVRQLFKMGELAEDFAVFVNIENALRRSGCLDAVEREFFTREAPDEDYPDEVCEECNLYWGKKPCEYVADFAGELNEVRAQALDEANLAIANTGDFANVFKVLAEMAASIRAGEVKNG